MSRHRSPRLWFILGGASVFVVVLFLAAWAGYVFFNPFRGFKGQELQLTIDGPERVVLGQEMTYFVNWQNVANEPLASADLRVSFPTDFTPTSIDPKPNGDGLAWKLGSVGFGGRGTLTIKGTFTGALGSMTAIQAVGTYRPASFNNDFESLATRELEYADSMIAGSIVAPEKALPGDKITFVYAVQNRGTSPQDGLEARLTLPQGFVREAASVGLLDGRVVRLPVGTLAAGASTTVAVSGSFASGSAGEATVHAELGRIGIDGAFQPAQKSDATFAVLSGDLTLKLVANGSDADQSVAEGDTMRFTLGYENSAEEPITDVAIRIRFEPLAATTTVAVAKKPTPPTPDFLDWSQLEDSSSGTVSGNQITWDKKAINVLANLPSKLDGTIEFSLPVLRNATGTAAFQVVAEATMKSVGNAVVNRTIKSSPITFRLRTDADLSSAARYFSEEGAPLGTGPLPPVVGQTTRYRIEWDLTKTLHELKNLHVTAVLPKNVAWPGKSVVDAGEIAYDESSRTVTWTVNDVSADAQETMASFDVDLTPGNLDAGRFADLLGETRVDFTDADLNELVSRTKPALTTDLQNDEGAKSKGVVRKP